VGFPFSFVNFFVLYFSLFLSSFLSFFSKKKRIPSSSFDGLLMARDDCDVRAVLCFFAFVYRIYIAFADWRKCTGWVIPVCVGGNGGQEGFWFGGGDVGGG